MAKSEAASRNRAPTNPDEESDRQDTYFAVGVGCAALALFVLSEVFGSAAILIGAYTWRREGQGGREGNRGLAVVILGIVAMLIGLYFTGRLALGSFLT